MKKLDESASAKPRMLSADMAIAEAWIPTHQQHEQRNQNVAECLHVKHKVLGTKKRPYLISFTKKTEKGRSLIYLRAIKSHQTPVHEMGSMFFKR